MKEIGENLTKRTLAGLKVVPVQERAPYLNMLIYGDSGVGKTTLAGSADAVPEMRPVLFVDVEGGTESLRHVYPDVDTVRVTKWNEIADLYSELQRGQHGYSTIVLDSLTEIQKFNMYEIMRALMAAFPDRDPDVPSMREWGKNLEQIRRFVRRFRDLPMHTVFTALSKEDKDEKTGKITTRPSLSGKLAGEVSAFLDIVGYYYVKTVKEEKEDHVRLLLTQRTEKFIAKDRSGKLPTVIESPTMKSLFDIMNSKTNTQENKK